MSTSPTFLRRFCASVFTKCSQICILCSKLHTSSHEKSVSTKQFYRRPLPRHCIALSSLEGKQLFREALVCGYMEPFFSLSGQLCTQEEPAYCGLATLVMVLNAFEMDPGRVWKSPWRWYHETMLNGLPKNVLTQGIALDEFAEIARAHGLSVELHHVESHDHVSVFRDLVSEMARTDKRGYLVCCYDRGAMGQSGSGHFAAIGGYHPYQELVFLFDTARFKYPSHWAPLARLWNGMGQVDPVTQKPRGYLVVTRTTTDRSVICCARHGPLQSSSSKLLLFTVSDSTRQAYLSPILHDKTSVGYRLRCVADDWLGWLSGVEQPVSGAMNASLIRQATSVLLDLCDKYRPDYFFLGVQQIADVPNISEPNLQEMQHRILRNLLKSDVGLSVRDVVLTLPGDVLSRLTTDSTFHQSIVKFYSDALSCSKSSVCPFAEVSDPGLRLTLLVTCFLYCFPYVEMCTTTLPPNCSSRSQRMSLVADSANLLQCTQTEIHILRTILCSFISSALKKNDSL